MLEPVQRHATVPREPQREAKTHRGILLVFFEELGTFSKAASKGHPGKWLEVEEKPVLKQPTGLQEAAGVLESQQGEAEPGARLPFFNYPSWSNKDIASPHGPSLF